MFLILILSLIVAAILLWVILRKINQSHRNNLFQAPLPPDSIAILKRNVSLYSRLPAELRDELHGRINIFLDEKEFTGLAGLTVTDEIRVTIAGTACLLLLKRDKRCFPGFTTILVYPDTYVAKAVNYDGAIESHEASIRSGESWHRGPVVLAWQDVLRGTSNQSDGHNVVLHEFAHKLDEENEIMDGLPVLRDSSHYAEWAEVLNREYESFQIRVNRNSNSVIDAYGAESPSEFFAVATESFFEKSLQMKQKLPDLYQQFKTFYNLDPAEWRERSD
jgi:Mlc titration factor MtfA (ptsG expression regulator)